MVEVEVSIIFVLPRWDPPHDAFEVLLFLREKNT